MTKELDRRFRHVGRIKRSWGTTHKPTIKLMEGMMGGLFERGYEEHRASLRQSLRYIESTCKVSATLNDLPGIIQRLDATLPDSSFNKARSAAQAFLRSTLKRSHPLWIAVTDIEAHTVTTTRKSHPLAVDEIQVLACKLSVGHARNAWGMFLSGMGPKEYWGKWHNGVIHLPATYRA